MPVVRATAKVFLLSSTGHAFRSQLKRVNGDEFEVSFLIRTKPLAGPRLISREQPPSRSP
jgi:hypothetical protein